MTERKILVIGGGIGGLTAAISLRQRGFAVDLIERDPEWAVYGVGIIQQSNSIRAMQELGLLEEYVEAGFAYDATDVYTAAGHKVASVPAPRLVEGKPASIGISRPALHTLLGESAKRAGATIKPGVTATNFDDDGQGVDVRFSDGSALRYDAVIAADGAYSSTREMLMPGAPKPEFVGQSVWRYNFRRPDEMVDLQTFHTDPVVGLVPLSDDLMYLFMTTAEPGNPWYPKEGLAAAMRSKFNNHPPQIQELASQIVDDEAVVYRPLEVLFLDGPWHVGRIAFIGDAVHTTTPHLAQGAGMAIEDAIVIADELAKDCAIEDAFVAYRERRFERCKAIVAMALSVCKGQLGEGPPVDPAKVIGEMYKLVSQPI